MISPFFFTVVFSDYSQRKDRSIRKFARQFLGLGDSQ